jgi:hypothetical protein
MALVDEVQITIKGGDGGDGLVHFYADAFRPKAAPMGVEEETVVRFILKVSLTLVVSINFVIPKFMQPKPVNPVVVTTAPVKMVKI